MTKPIEIHLGFQICEANCINQTQVNVSKICLTIKTPRPDGAGRFGCNLTSTSKPTFNFKFLRPQTL